MVRPEEDKVREFLYNNSADDSGIVKNVFITGDEVIKAVKSPSWLRTADVARDKLESLEEAGIPHPRTEVEEFDLSDIPVHGEIREDQENYGENCTTVFQDRVDTLERFGREELEDVLNIVDYAAQHGIVFPDNSADNWGYVDGELNRVDVTDDMSVVDYGDNVGQESVEYNLRNNVGHIREDLEFDPEEDVETLLREQSEFYSRAGYIPPSKVS